MEKFSMEFTVEEWRLLIAAAVADRDKSPADVQARLRSIAKRIASRTCQYDNRVRATVALPGPATEPFSYRPLVYAGVVVALVLIALIGVSVM